MRLWDSHSLVRARDRVTHSKSPSSPWEDEQARVACPRMGEGSSQLTQACAARCTHPGHPHRSLAPHLLSPTGERQRTGSEGDSHPQSQVEPCSEKSARQLGCTRKSKALAHSLPKRPLFLPLMPVHASPAQCPFQQASLLDSAPSLGLGSSTAHPPCFPAGSTHFWVLLQAALRQQLRMLAAAEELPAPWHCSYVLLCQAATGPAVMLGCPCCCLNGETGCLLMNEPQIGRKMEEETFIPGLCMAGSFLPPCPRLPSHPTLHFQGYKLWGSQPPTYCCRTKSSRQQQGKPRLCQPRVSQPFILPHFLNLTPVLQARL